jgi:hippurate hydrolase
MLNDGLFTRFPRPDFALSFHDDDTMPAGHDRLSSRAVPRDVRQRQHRRLRPWRARRDAARHRSILSFWLRGLVIQLQTIVSRENNPVDPVVVTVGSIHGGTQGNVIPDEVRLQLSVRTYTPDVR